MPAFDWIAYVLLPALVILGAPLALWWWADDMPRSQDQDDGSDGQEPARWPEAA